MASCATGFRYLSITLCSRRYIILCFSISYSMSAHLAVPVSHCPFTTPSQTFVTSCLIKDNVCIQGDEEDQTLLQYLDHET